MIEIQGPWRERLVGCDGSSAEQRVRSLALLASRAILGAHFVAAGYPKVHGGPGKTVSPFAARYLGPGFGQSMERGGVPSVAAAFRQLGIPTPELLARFVSFLELGGGTLLALGVLTRPLAMLFVGEMVVVIQKVHWRNGLHGPGGFDYPLALLAACLGLIGAGAGDFSIDHLFCQMSAQRRVKRASTTDVARALVSALALGAVVARLGRGVIRTRETYAEPGASRTV